MTIEVRQMTIKTSVCGESPHGSNPQKLETTTDIERFREDILIECRTLLEERLNQLRDR
ncbi:MAG: DUF5908 family protein [Burkholderiales bacterium]